MHNDPIVETSLGKVRGLRLEGSLAFLGIRYGAAERFEAPEPASPWAGIAGATEFGTIAPQSDPNPSPAGYGIILEHLGSGSPPAPPESEDCLTLNVWTSDLVPPAPRPVMVWLHPGFFMLGSGMSGNGANLTARGDVISVSLNHRLNLFGFTHLDDIANGFQYSGNAGMLDIVLALQWVRDNIARFGGDPNRVMVFGASGGGMKTAWLLASPAGDGLLHRAGAQSGPCLRLMERGDASEVSAMLLHELEIGVASADDLRRMPVARLLAAYHRLRTRLRPRRFTHLTSFVPVIDPDLLPHHPFDPTAPAQSASVPLLIGWNQQDMAFFPGSDLAVFELTETSLAERAGLLLGDAEGADAIARYRAEDGAASPSELYLRLFSDWSIGSAVIVQAERKAALGAAPAYVYRFDHPSPAFEGRLGAVHSSETGYVFGTRGPFADAATRLSDHMQSRWTEFAATGEISDWPAFDAERAVMRLGAEPRIVRNPIPQAAAWIDA